MLTKLKSDIFAKEAMCYDALFKELSGNPTSVVILASVLANPTLKCNTLADLYVSTIKERRDHFED